MFGAWQSRLGYDPPAGIAPATIPGRVLYSLAMLSPKASLTLYDLVLGVRGWGAGEDLSSLKPRQKEEALDAFLFLSDCMRYEVMRRLDWVEAWDHTQTPLEQLAQGDRSPKSHDAAQVPRLCISHPRYPELEHRLKVEPVAVVRSLIPQALDEFKMQLDNQVS